MIQLYGGKIIMYTTILFDLDGTVSDSAEGIINCVEYSLAEVGISVPRSELLCFVGPPLVDMFMQKFGFDEQEAAARAAKYRERYHTIGVCENSAYDGMEQLLQRLKAAGLTLAVATSKPTKFARQIIERYGFSTYFDLVLGSEFDGTRHTKAQVVADVLTALGIGEDNKDSAVMIGDRSYDVEGAKACGIACIGVSYGYADPGEVENAGAIAVYPTPAALGDALLGE
jgi:phosphoglycolate phosphatase